MFDASLSWTVTKQFLPQICIFLMSTINRLAIGGVWSRKCWQLPLDFLFVDKHQLMKISAFWTFVPSNTSSWEYCKAVYELFEPLIPFVNIGANIGCTSLSKAWVPVNGCHVNFWSRWVFERKFTTCNTHIKDKC